MYDVYKGKAKFGHNNRGTVVAEGEKQTALKSHAPKAKKVSTHFGRESAHAAAHGGMQPLKVSYD